jgi:hypothetical protein
VRRRGLLGARSLVFTFIFNLMSDSHAQAGVIAANAGGTAGENGAQDSTITNTDAANSGAETADGVGKVEVTDDDKSAKPVEKAAKPDAKTAKTSAKAEKAGETAKKVVEKTKDLVNTVLDEAAKAAKTVVGETATIKVLRSHPELGAWPGEITTIGATLAAELIAGKFAETATATAE